MEGDSKKKIAPPLVQVHPETETVTIDIPTGKVLIEPKDGSKPFLVNEATANKIYSDKDKFEIKKKQ